MLINLNLSLNCFANIKKSEMYLNFCSTFILRICLEQSYVTRQNLTVRNMKEMHVLVQFNELSNRT